MPAVTLHSLRHTHASMLIASGVDILTISRRLAQLPDDYLERLWSFDPWGDNRAAQIMDAAFGSKMVATGDRKPEK